MKDLEYYLNLPWTEYIERNDKWYFARIKELPECMIDGETAKEALENLKIAKELVIRAMMRCGEKIKEPKIKGDKDE